MKREVNSQRGKKKKEWLLKDYSFHGNKAWDSFTFSHFTHKLTSESYEFLVNKNSPLFQQRKVVKADTKMLSKYILSVLIYASENQFRYQRHCFNSFKNLEHNYKLHPWCREITLHYLSLQHNYNKIPAESVVLEIYVVGFSSSCKTWRVTFLSKKIE